MRYVGREFRNQTVVLDGNSYDGCTIVNCDLNYSGTTEISLTNCTMGANEFVYAGCAALTVRTLQEIARTGAGGLDHVMRLLLGGAPIDWRKVAEIGELPEKTEDPTPSTRQQTEKQRKGITIRWRGTHAPTAGELPTQSGWRGSSDRQ
jgi:hypothetical protein